VNKRVVSLLAAVAIVLLFCLMPIPDGLNRGGLISLGLLLAGILLWITEAMPLAISALLLMVLMPYLGVTNFPNVWAKFISPVIFFVIAAFGLTVALLKTNIPLRITASLMKWSGTNAPKLVFGFLLCTALVSTIVTNTADCALFMGLALSMLRANNSIPGKSNLGKCLMMGVPMAAVIGGGVTPAGVSINIMAMNMFTSHTGITIKFLDWVAMGLPMAIILLPICWWCLIRAFKPEDISEESLQTVLKQADVLGPLNIVEKKVLAIVTLMLVFWVAGNWVPALDATAVAVFGLVVMFLPGVDLLTFDELTKGVSWNVVLLIGGVQSLAAGILSTGAAGWLVKSAMAVVAGASNTTIMAGATTLLSFLHVIIPVGPAIAGMTTIPLADVASLTGISPVAMTVMVAFWGAISFVLPIDCVPLITYGQGYYKMIDMVKAGWFPTIVLIAYCTFVLPVLARMLGY
jgi:solute carrier family 13 (sodium-dependent dicarboxylate transporter), member 2/3/5